MTKPIAAHTAWKRAGITLITLGLFLASPGLARAGEGEATPPREPGPERRRAIEQRIEQLHQQGRHEEAEAMAARLERARELREHAPNAEAWPSERRELAERMQALRREIAELRRAGAHEEAERRLREAQEIAEQARRAGRFVPPGAALDRPEPERVERQRRAHHLRVAAENLAAIGLHEQAERLMREAEMTELPQEGRPMPGPVAEREAAWREMHEQLEQLRAALRDLNARVDRLTEGR